MQAIRNAAAHMPGSQNCWQRNWPRVFLFFALATTVLCFVSIITGLITAILHPQLVLLSIYCLIFALLGFSAELRQFSWCRRVVYLWMRYFYFLTYYKARAVFYIMFGFLLLTSRTLDIIAAIVTLVLGFMMLVVALIVDLPVFEDPREQQQKEEEFRNYYSGPTPNNTNAAAMEVSAASSAASNNNANTNAKIYSDVQSDTPAQFNSGTGTTSRPVTQVSPKVPPGAMPAQTNHSSNNHDTYRDSSDDEPAGRNEASAYSGASPNANPYETNNVYGATIFGSGGKSGPNMFAPSTSSRTASVAPPLQEAGVTRGTNSESAIRRDFAAAVASNLKDDDLR